MKKVGYETVVNNRLAETKFIIKLENYRSYASTGFCHLFNMSAELYSLHKILIITHSIILLDICFTLP